MSVFMHSGTESYVASGGSQNPLVHAILHGILSQPLEQTLSFGNNKVSQTVVRADNMDTGKATIGGP